MSFAEETLIFKNYVKEFEKEQACIMNELEVFGTNLQQLEKDMAPTYRLTESLALAQENLTLTLEEFYNVITIYDVPKKVEKIITSVPTTNLEEYLQAIKELNGSMDYLNKHKSYKSTEATLTQAKSLVKQGMKYISEEFLLRISMIPCKEENQQKQKEGVKKDSSEEDEEKSSIGKWDEETTENEVVPVQTVPERQETIHEAYEEKLKTIRVLLQSLNDYSEEKTKVQLIVEYANARLQVINQYLKGNETTTNESQQRKIDVQYMEDLFDIFQEEKEISMIVFPDATEYITCFKAIALPIMISIHTQLKLDYGSMYGSPKELLKCLPLFNHIYTKRKEFAQMLQIEENEELLLKKMKEIQQFLADTCVSFLRNFVEDISEKSMLGKQTPKDGNVHPMSSNVMSVLRHLYVSVDIIKNVLLQVPSEISSCDSYIDSTINKLIEFITLKSVAYKDPALADIFILNNVYYIILSLDKFQEIDKSKSVVDKTAIKFYKTQAKKLNERVQVAKTELISISYGPLAQILRDPESPLINQKGSELLTLESGRQLKAKFTSFNTKIEELYQTQTEYTISDHELRETIQRNAYDMVVPLYKRFYEKYSKVRFSKKNMSKYLKYSPEKVEQYMKELFNGTIEKSPNKAKIKK